MSGYKSNLSEELNDYLIRFREERESVDFFRSYLADPDSKKFGKSHLTGSSWIVNRDGTETLLTHHAKLGMWLQLGGHIEQDESVLDASLREAKEESGLTSLRILDERIYDIDAHIIPAGPKGEEHYHFDIRYLLQADSDEDLMISDESRDLKWVKPDEVAGYNSNESVLRMLRKMKRISK